MASATDQPAEPHNYDLLPPNLEDDLHARRLLSVESRYFVAITKKLCNPEVSYIFKPPVQLPSPPPDASAVDEAAAAQLEKQTKQDEDRATWREEVILAFQGLDSSVVRMQFLRNSNDVERARYEVEKTKILDTMASIRQRTSELRTQLDEARNMLSLRKEYDKLAEKITEDKELRSRDEQSREMASLEEEIRQLRDERSEDERKWVERREQFARVAEESRAMVRLIKGEPEVEEMEVDAPADGEGEAGTGGNTPMHHGERDVDDTDGRERSNANTPRLGATPLHVKDDSGGLTPLHLSDEASGGATPSRLAVPGGLKPIPRSRGASPAPSERAKDSDLPSEDAPKIEIPKSGEDDEMEEGEEGEATPVEKMEE